MPSKITLTRNKSRPRSKPKYPPFPKDDEALVRLPQVLSVLPVGRTFFQNGVKEGRFPKPIKLGRNSLWRAGDIRALLGQIMRGSHDQ
jgi:prophage regulatory protein